MGILANVLTLIVLAIIVAVIFGAGYYTATYRHWKRVAK